MAEPATLTDQIAERLIAGDHFSAPEVATQFGGSSGILYSVKKKLEGEGYKFKSKAEDDGVTRWFIASSRAPKSRASTAKSNGSARRTTTKSAAKRRTSTRPSSSNGSGAVAAVLPMLGDKLTVVGLLIGDAILLRDSDGVEYRAVLTQS